MSGPEDHEAWMLEKSTDWAKPDREAFRVEQQERRDAGLRARHETRLRRAIRREIGEEIAVAIETHFPDLHVESAACQRCFLVAKFAGLAREIGSKGGSDD